MSETELPLTVACIQHGGQDGHESRYGYRREEGAIRVEGVEGQCPLAEVGETLRRNSGL